MDHYEAEIPDSEETVAFAIASEAQFGGLQEFYQATGEYADFHIDRQFELPIPVNLALCSASGKLVQFFQDETQLTLENDTEVFVLCDEWNDVDVLLKVKHYLVRFCWFMTA